MKSDGGWDLKPWFCLGNSPSLATTFLSCRIQVFPWGPHPPSSLLPLATVPGSNYWKGSAGMGTSFPRSPLPPPGNGKQEPLPVTLLPHPSLCNGWGPRRGGQEGPLGTWAIRKCPLQACQAPRPFQLSWEFQRGSHCLNSGLEWGSQDQGRCL